MMATVTAAAAAMSALFTLFDMPGTLPGGAPTVTDQIFTVVVSVSADGWL